ncbi:putative ABC transporter G family member 9-like [Capsicum annuum]|nr:putative ABC transporter G family member 9-like [Capsicum annuum]
MKTEMADFNFDSACTSPYISAPSSPQHLGKTFFFSAPTSPTRISALNRETNIIHDNNDAIDDDTNGYAFEFSGHEMEKSSVTAADELFDGGKIKPKPVLSFESKQKKKEIESIAEDNELGNDDGRGRERNQHSKLSSSGSRRHKATRSLSPMRVADLLLIDENDESINTEKTEAESSVSSLISLWNSWKLKDLLLFRSASESRVSSRTEELNKYALVKKLRQEDVKKVGLSSRRRRTGPISAHELHYKMKRDVLKEMKKKTFLPYKRSVLSWHGCYGLDDTISMYMTPRPQ